MADMELQLAETASQRGRVTAAQLDSGLVTGRYSITAAEADKAGLPSQSGFIDAFYDSRSFQTQIYRRWSNPMVGAWRFANSSGWSDWTQIS